MNFKGKDVCTYSTYIITLFRGKRRNVHTLWRSHFFLLLQASASALQVFSRKLKRKQIFSQLLAAISCHPSTVFSQKCSLCFTCSWSFLPENSRYFLKFSQAIFKKMRKKEFRENFARNAKTEIFVLTLITYVFDIERGCTSLYIWP